MQQLHLVGFTTDLEGLIFSVRKGSKSGSFMVPLDERLLATIAETLRRREGATADDMATARALAHAAGYERRSARPESKLSPRQIQARLRAGQPQEEVAAEAGVDAEWIDRFAAPIIAEQLQVLDRAHALTLVKRGAGPSTQPFGAAVRWNLADRGVRLRADQFAAAWDVSHLHDSTWAIRLTYESRRRPHVAEWEVDLESGELIARNRVATELAHVEKGRRRRPPPLETDPSPGLVPGPPPPVGTMPPTPPVEPAPEITVAPEPRRRPATRARRAKAAQKAKKAGKTRPAAKKAVKKAKKAVKKTTVVKKKARKNAVRKKATPKRAVKKRAVKKKPVRKKATARRGTRPPSAPPRAPRRRPLRTRPLTARRERPLRAR